MPAAAFSKMALMRESDTGLWLHIKLGSADELWSLPSIASLLTASVIDNVRLCFHNVSSAVKLLLGMLHHPRRTVDEDVLHRHALYLTVSMVCYDDGLVAGKSLLALKTKDPSEDQYNLWVYQCNSLDQAQAICKVLSTSFDAVLSEKSRVPAE